MEASSVFLIDLDNMEAYSDNYHCVLNKCYTTRKAAVDALAVAGFKPVHDGWRGETVYRWQGEPDESGFFNCKEGPFGFSPSLYGEAQATIIKCEVVK